METYLKLFAHLLDNDGKMALGIIYDDSLKEYYDNAYAVLRYKLTNININMNCLCGVHINTVNEYELLFKMLDIWKTQYLPVNLYLSISHNEDIVINLSKYIDEHFKLFIQKEKCSQFRHYNHILNNIEIENNQWVFFANFNDIWMKNRSCAFNTLINLYNTTKFKDDKKPLYIKYSFTDPGNPDINHNQFCCRMVDFTKFMENIDNSIIDNDICNLYSIKFLNLNDETHLALPNPDLFGIICHCNTRINYENNNLREMIIYYFSKKMIVTVPEFKNFWNYYIKEIDFDVVKKNFLEMYNNNIEDFKIYRDSILITDEL